ncbi:MULTISPECIES: hypothetical protein [Rugamonas]|jgi:hypothetical protein|uniref:Uncharacterized protein n=1 Tax=Rugamonas rubra TaxID=758825 RepID=A0A1I4SVI4_9BURK|nr:MULTISPECIES: hypothetical protein [Rugamonas]WGG52801.1 hypothetical protein QC826_12035 [Rugamonas sp. DEMB1]SFM68452.1 hypothetical protein SAMN02982985_04934 [Rugamonas rubra]
MKIQAINDNNAAPASVSVKSSNKGVSFGSFMAAATAAESGPAAELAAYAKMTPAQRMRASVLSSMGLKESDLANMSAADRQAIEEKIAAKIKEKLDEEIQKKALKIG